MSSKSFNYLQPKLRFTVVLFTFIATLFISACGIKGDLYQTPEQPPAAKADENAGLTPKAEKAEQQESSVEVEPAENTPSSQPKEP